MPAFGYRREQADPADPEAGVRSLDAQGLAIAALCGRRKLELVAMYTDRLGERRGVDPQWLALLRDAASLAGAPDAPTVVLPSLKVVAERARDRLLRALQVHGTGVTVLLATEERLPDAMASAWNERADSDRHAERVREGMQRRALRGHALGRPPFGYRVREHRLEVDREEAEIVRELVRFYLGGLGVRRLAAQLNDRGVTTRSGRPWSATAVRDILRNPTYLGTSRRLGVIVSDAHEAILGRAEYEAVQRRMSERRTAPAEQERRAYLLAGLLRCGYCGNRLIGVRRPGADHELIYYQCESATNQGRCGYHSRRAYELEAEVRERLADMADQIGPAYSDASSAVVRLEARQRTLQREVDRALGNWTNGRWGTQRLLGEASEAAYELLEVEVALNALRGNAEAPPVGGGAPDLRHLLAVGWEEQTFDEQRALLQRHIREVTVTDDGLVLTLGAGDTGSPAGGVAS